MASALPTSCCPFGFQAVGSVLLLSNEERQDVERYVLLLITRARAPISVLLLRSISAAFICDCEGKVVMNKLSVDVQVQVYVHV